MDAQLLAPLASLESKLNALLTAMASSPTAAGAPAATVALLEADDALTSALQALRTHQANYAKILRLRAEAQSLEERVRSIVREIEGIGKEISAACDHSDGSDSDGDNSSEEEDDIDTEMGGASELAGLRHGGRKKEIDYRLLLDFARRISRYNTQAAADAAAGIPTKSLLGQTRQASGDTGMATGGVNGNQTLAGEGNTSSGVGVASLTQETVSWLDETASWARDSSLVSYPSDERIRMGIMGQLQMAAGEGADPEEAVERMILAAEGRPDSAGISGMDVVGENALNESVARSGPPVPSRPRHSDAGVRPVPGAAKPKPKLDLDLYDPDDDDA